MRNMTLALGAATTLLGLLAAAPALAGQCRDPWITQAVHEVTGRWPNGDYESGECTYTQYGGGHWNSYAQLKGYVQARLSPPLFYTPSADLRLSSSQVRSLPTTSVAGVGTVYVISGKYYKLISSDSASMTLRLINENPHTNGFH